METIFQINLIKLATWASGAGGGGERGSIPLLRQGKYSIIGINVKN